MEKPSDVVSFEKDQIPTLNMLLDTLFSKSLSSKNSSVLPTVETVAAGEIVIYDDGAGTKRLYVVTGKKNLGYVNLT